MALPKRSMLETKIDILKAIQRQAERQSQYWRNPYSKRFVPTKEVIPTRIMGEANVSWRPLQTILAELLESGLLTNLKVKTTRYYSLTPKGEEAIRDFDNLVRKINMAGPDKPINLVPY